MNSKKDTFNPVTVWFAGDFSQSNARSMLSAALQHLKANSRSMRLSVLFPEWSEVNRVLDAAIASINSQQALNGFLQKYLLYLEENPDSLSKPALLISDALGLLSQDHHAAFNERLEVNKKADAEVVQLHRAFTSRVLQMSPGDLSIVLNGKVYAVPASEPFTVDDFSLMEKFISGIVTDKVVELLTEKEKNAGLRKASDLILKLSSALLSKTQSKTRYDINNVQEDHSVLVLEPRHPDQPSVELAAILDPLTR